MLCLQRNGYVRGVVEDVLHDPGRGAPMVSIKFRNPYRNQRDVELMVAPEGVYSGQFVYFGKKAQVAVGNVLPLSSLPEGSVVCNVERYPGDRGKLAKTSGEYVTVITHNEDTGLTKVRMPSGAKKNISSDARAMVRAGAIVCVTRGRVGGLWCVCSHGCVRGELGCCECCSSGVTPILLRARPTSQAAVFFAWGAVHSAYVLRVYPVFHSHAA